MKAKVTQSKTSQIKKNHFIRSNAKRPPISFFTGDNPIKFKVLDSNDLDALLKLSNTLKHAAPLTIKDLSRLCSLLSKWVSAHVDKSQFDQKLYDVMYDIATFAMVQFNSLTQTSLDKLENKKGDEFIQMIYDLGILGAACLVDKPILSSKKLNEIGLFLLKNTILTPNSIINFIAGWALLAKYKALDQVNIKTDIFNQLLNYLKSFNCTLSDKDIIKTLYSLALIKESTVSDCFTLSAKLIDGLQSKLKWEASLENEKLIKIYHDVKLNLIMPKILQIKKEEPSLEESLNPLCLEVIKIAL